MLISVRQIRSAKSAVSACESFLALINTFIFPVKSSDNNSSHVQSFKWGSWGIQTARMIHGFCAGIIDGSLRLYSGMSPAPLLKDWTETLDEKAEDK